MPTEMISINPATGEEIGRTTVTDPDAIPAMVKRLRKALRNRRDVTLGERVAIVKRAANIIREEGASISELVTKEMGKLIREARAEVDNAALRLDYFAKTAPAALEEIEERLPGVLSVTRFEPVGVVAAIKPWNFPVGIPLWSMAPALLAGDTVLFKPSERTPLVGKRIFEIFRRAGLPEGVMEIAQGAEDVGRAIVASDCDMIAFVGSQAVGKYIMRNSAERIRRLALELGGKDPMIVCADCDFDATVAGAVAGAFKNCGQVCCGVERVLVAREIFDRFSRAVAERASRLKTGDGMDPATDMGPMNCADDVDRVERLIEDAVSKGARILCGGKRIEGKGFFFEPTVVTDVTDEMRISKEEIFGPVIALTPFDSVDRAIEMANATRFGLTASVWSSDARMADKIARRIEAGTIAINQVVGSIVECPWGGVKESGLGRMLGAEAVREFTETVNYRYPEA